MQKNNNDNSNILNELCLEKGAKNFQTNEK